MAVFWVNKYLRLWLTLFLATLISNCEDFLLHGKEICANNLDCNLFTKKCGTQNIHSSYRQSPKLVKMKWRLLFSELINFLFAKSGEFGAHAPPDYLVLHIFQVVISSCWHIFSIQQGGGEAVAFPSQLVVKTCH